MEILTGVDLNMADKKDTKIMAIVAPKGPSAKAGKTMGKRIDKRDMSRKQGRR